MTELIIEKPIILCFLKKFSSDIDFIKELYKKKAEFIERIIGQSNDPNNYGHNNYANNNYNAQVNALNSISVCVDNSIRDLFKL